MSESPLPQFADLTNDHPSPPLPIDYATPASVLVLPRRYPFVRLVCAVFAIGYPAFGLLMNAQPSHDGVPVDWQNGQPLAWLSLVTIPKVGAPLWPFLGFAWMCIAFAALMPTRAARSTVCRLGLWVGVVMGAEFVTIVAIGMARGAPSDLAVPAAVQLGGLVAGWIALLLCGAIERLWNATLSGSAAMKRRVGIFAALALVASVGAGAIAGRGVWMIPLVVPLLGVLIAAPLSIAAHGRMLMVLRRPIFGEAIDRDRSADRRWAVLLSLVLPPLHAVAWFATWEFASQAYRGLPTTQPSYCFVATAAANSRRSVRTRHRQLRTLRAFESWLAARRPMTHAVLRRRYNAIGPRVARRIDTAGRADAMHRALAVVQWMAANTLWRA